MRPARSVASRLRAVSELRRLCLALPHVPTPRERAWLSRFAVLSRSPATARAADVEALAVGWRAWWRAGEIIEIATMARRLPPGLVEGDRRLATYAVAAGAGDERLAPEPGPGKQPT